MPANNTHVKTSTIVKSPLYNVYNKYYLLVLAMSELLSISCLNSISI